MREHVRSVQIVFMKLLLAIIKRWVFVKLQIWEFKSYYFEN